MRLRVEDLEAIARVAPRLRGAGLAELGAADVAGVGVALAGAADEALGGALAEEVLPGREDPLLQRYPAGTRGLEEALGRVLAARIAELAGGRGCRDGAHPQTFRNTPTTRPSRRASAVRIGL
jgi:hypothetical protein